MIQTTSKFFISLDFELYWGLRDKLPLEKYKNNLLHVHSVVPELLKLFREFDIHATWATVGFLFYESFERLRADLPIIKPMYKFNKFDPYNYINNVIQNENLEPYHFAASLIKKIISTPFQEIGTHTFSHYYCLEEGQNTDTFRYDLCAAKKIANEYNIKLESIVFPRNQYNYAYLNVCREEGITAYRKSLSWKYKPVKAKDNLNFKRIIRFLDSYFNLSGFNSYKIRECYKEYPIGIPLSRFLYPYSDKFKILESIRLFRILSELTYAAKNGMIYHLCLHPHNFGNFTETNLKFFKKILLHFVKLRDKYKIESLTMSEFANQTIYAEKI